MMSALSGSSIIREVRTVLADEKTVFFLTEKIVGDLYGVRGRENISPRYWKNGILFCSCKSPLWANELWITREALRDRINRELGYEGVKEIKTSD